MRRIGRKVKNVFVDEGESNRIIDWTDSSAGTIHSSNYTDTDTTPNSTNVESAGALMDSEVTNLSQVKAFNSSDYATSAQGANADTAHGWGDHDNKIMPWITMTGAFNPDGASSANTDYHAPGNQGILSTVWSTHTTDFDDGTDKVVWWRQTGIFVPFAMTLCGVHLSMRYGYQKTFKFKFLQIPAADIKVNVNSGNNTGLTRVAETTLSFAAGPASASAYNTNTWTGSVSLAAGDMLMPMIKSDQGDWDANAFFQIHTYIKASV